MQNVQICCKSIEIVKSTKCLCVEIDNNLLWNKQIDAVCKNFNAKLKKTLHYETSINKDPRVDLFLWDFSICPLLHCSLGQLLKIVFCLFDLYTIMIIIIIIIKINFLTLSNFNSSTFNLNTLYTFHFPLSFAPHYSLKFARARRNHYSCLLYTSPSPRDGLLSRMPSSA